MTNDAHLAGDADLPAAALPTGPAEQAEAAAEQPEPRETQHAPIEVGLQRSVRYGRIIVGATILGAIVGLIASLFFPVEEGANYELRQAAGVALVAGGVIGLTVGALVSLLLGIIASRSKGAAIAVQTDVR